MNVDALQVALEAVGWQRSNDTLESPTGNVWVTTAELSATEACELYASTARRAESALRHGDTVVRDEYSALLQALSVEPSLQLMLGQCDAARIVIEPWAKHHGMTLRLWDFSRPSVRAEARHPEGGIACVEWVWAEPPILFLYHWIDDSEHHLRSSWKETFEARSPEGGELLHQLDRLANMLLAKRPFEAYVASALSPGTQSASGHDH